MLIHVYSIVCYHVQGGSGSVSVYTNSISPSIVVVFLWVREFSEFGCCGQGALCFLSIKFVQVQCMFLLYVCMYIKLYY